MTNNDRALLERFADFCEIDHLVIDQFLATDPGPDAYFLRDDSGDNIGWWMYLPSADRWLCFGLEDDGTLAPDHIDPLELLRDAPTKVPSCVEGFDQGVAEIIASFGIDNG